MPKSTYDWSFERSAPSTRAGRSSFVDRSQLRIVAGGDGVGIDLPGEFPQLAELQPVVAHHARVGRAAGQVLVGKVILDPPESVLEIERIKRDVEQVGHAARVGGVGRATTALLMSAAAGLGVPLSHPRWAWPARIGRGPPTAE